MSDLLHNLSVRAAANREALETRRSNAKLSASIDDARNTVAQNLKQKSSNYILPKPLKRDLTAFVSKKAGSILYIYICDENSAFTPEDDNYLDFIADPLYKNVFTGCVVQIPQSDGTYYDLELPEGWDQPYLRLDSRDALGLYDLLQESQSDFSVQRNLADYSIVYFVIDSSGSMDEETIKDGVQEFYTKLVENRTTRSNQLYAFSTTALSETLAVEGTTTKIADWLGYEDLETYLQEGSFTAYYRKKDASIIFTSRDPRELIVPPAQDFFDWLGQDELEFYRVPGKT